MPDTVGAHLKALHVFSGREARAQFWPFVAAVILGTMAAMLVLMIVGIAILDGLPRFDHLLYGVGLMSLLVVVCLASAVARRLHDRGLNGAWGLMPVPFLAFTYYAMSRVFASFGDGAQDTFSSTAMVSNLLYNLSLIILILLLIKPSDEGGNRYGPNPRDVSQPPIADI